MCGQSSITYDVADSEHVYKQTVDSNINVFFHPLGSSGLRTDIYTVQLLLLKYILSHICLCFNCYNEGLGI